MKQTLQKFFISFLAILFLTQLLAFSANSQQSEITKADSVKLNRSNLLRVIDSLNIKYPDIAYAQALIESGSLKSHLARVNHNIFGMKVSEYRKSTAIGHSRFGYARYANWIESVKDYSNFQEKVFSKYGEMSKEEYLRYLNRKYAESKGYAKKIRISMRNNRLDPTLRGDSTAIKNI